IVKQPINVGIAVNTSQGLLVPVLRDAEQLELTAIAEKSALLIEGARAGTLPPNQMSGGTITVTNVGASGPVETGTPIINPPECCVVAFGAIKPRRGAGLLELDVRPVVEISQRVGIPIEVATFIGSSPIRQYAEGWTIEQMVDNTRKAVRFARQNQMHFLYLTEATTRAQPETLRRLFGPAI